MKPVGRFAPSPTGPLHMGSLLTALASYLHVKSREGRWLIRIDDLDPVRTVPGAADAILTTLAQHGLLPDGAPIFQSQNLSRYEKALAQLEKLGLTFGCRCSRKQLAGNQIYPGHCRQLGLAHESHAIRLRVPDRLIRFQDGLKGLRTQNVSQSPGDIVLRRRDGHFAYHLACAVDDGNAEINEVFRGEDLLGETPAQIMLMELLGLKVPRFLHIPVLRNSHGEKLSKQTGALGINHGAPAGNLIYCLGLLGIHLPADAPGWPVSRLIEGGIAGFQLQNIPDQLSRVETQ